MTTRILIGDCRDKLREIETGSVHCIVTSPPYFGLRDYGTAQWEGGDADCDHLAPVGGGFLSASLGDRPEIAADKVLRRRQQFRDLCSKCGASRIDQQIGLEATPEAYVAALVAVFRECWRVLRDDGTLWLNLGDSYAADRGGTAMPAETLAGGINGKGDGDARRGREFSYSPTRDPKAHGLKHKDLMMIPARVALALQQEGWYLRSEIVWAKPNPMPESVTDRPTNAHEKVYLLTKRPRYFWDAEAVKESSAEPDRGPRADRFGGSKYDESVKHSNGSIWKGEAATRNLRNVWTISTQPYSEAHFATFPPALVEPMIKAGTSEKGCCPACGAPWRRVTKTEYRRHEKWFGDKQGARNPRGSAGVAYNEPIATQTVGWQLSCPCPPAPPVPATILDPFAGAGTVGLVADRLGRNAVLIELNASYIAMAADRITDDAPLFAEVIREP